MGDFNFDALRDADAILGPTYFILYVFFVFFILLNMFLAIINDTYSEVKAELAGQPNDIDVAGFFKVVGSITADFFVLLKNNEIKLTKFETFFKEIQ